MATRVAINGFGRIGRLVFRAALETPTVDVVAVNDLFSAKILAHLLKYDSVHGPLGAQVQAKENAIVVDGKEIEVTAIKDPATLPWKAKGVEIAVEATGVFRKRDGAAKHLSAGAKKVIITAPADDPDVTLCMGVNEKTYDPAKHHIISNASCTTNCLAPLAKVLMDEFGIKRGLMTTIHSYTNDQRILDLAHKDLRRARAAALSMIPTKTGAAAAIGLVIPELKGKMDGLAIRVPTPNVSLVDLVAELEKQATAEQVISAFKKAAAGAMKGILDVCEVPLVSHDFNHTTTSCIVDAENVRIIDGNFAKVLAWYDNEWAYSCRVVDLVKLVAE
jgi:glyceraldehyde 3-phosphate dehydrogenase